MEPEEVEEPSEEEASEEEASEEEAPSGPLFGGAAPPKKDKKDKKKVEKKDKKTAAKEAAAAKKASKKKPAIDVEGAAATMFSGMSMTGGDGDAPAAQDDDDFSLLSDGPVVTQASSGVEESLQDLFSVPSAAEVNQTQPAKMGGGGCLLYTSPSPRD